MTTILHSQPGLEVRRVATCEPRISVLRIDVTQSPDDIEAAMGAARLFLDTYPGRVVTHAHVACDERPGMAQIVALVRGLMDLQTVMDAKLKGTIVEVTDQRIEWSLSAFNTLYRPTSAQVKRRVFEIVHTSEDAQRVLDGILAHKAEKQRRRASRS